MSEFQTVEKASTSRSYGRSMTRKAQEGRPQFSKVRTGCLTCKQRRVKCDEGKPVCRRCTVGKHRCAGYVSPKPWLFVPYAKFNTKVKSASNSVSQTVGSPERQSQSYLSSTESLDSEGGSTQNPVLVFRNEASQMVQIHRPQPTRNRSQMRERMQLSIPVSPSYGTPEEGRGLQFFLESCTVQISNYNASYYWSVIVPQASWQQPAIKQSLLALASSLESLLITGSTSLTIKQRSLRQYNAAIRSLLRDRPQLETVLMTCCLLWGCEYVDGRHSEARAHQENALRILNEWRSNKARQGTSWNDGDYLIANEIAPVVHVLADLAKTTSIGTADGRGERHVKLPISNLQTRLSETTPFVHFHEAANLLSACIKYLAQQGETSALDIHIPSLNEVRDILQQWHHNFKITPFDTNSKFVATMAGLHHLAASVLVESLDKQLDTSAKLDFPDASLLRNTFQTKHVSSSIHFRSQLGLIPPLFMLGRHAPVKATREVALGILKNLHRVEGQWDSCIAAAILAEVQDIEDEADLGRLVDLGPYGTWKPSIDTIYLTLRQSELWMSWTWASGPQNGRTNERQVQCIEQGVRQLEQTPTHSLDSLLRNFGYQDSRADLGRNQHHMKCSCTTALG